MVDLKVKKYELQAEIVELLSVATMLADAMWQGDTIKRLAILEQLGILNDKVRNLKIQVELIDNGEWL